MKLEPLIYVSDLKASIIFYKDTLGFEVGELYPSDNNPTYAPIIIGKDKLMLVQARKSNQKFYEKGICGSGVQLFIKVNDVDAIYKKVKDEVKIFDEIETKSWGDREFTIKDPDGYLITFYSQV